VISIDFSEPLPQLYSWSFYRFVQHRRLDILTKLNHQDVKALSGDLVYAVLLDYFTLKHKGERLTFHIPKDEYRRVWTVNELERKKMLDAIREQMFIAIDD